MKQINLLIFLLGFVTAVQAQTAGDQILGKWKNEAGNSQIEFQKTGDTYLAKLVWMAEPNDANGNPKLDKNNPNEKLRNRPLIGITLISGLHFDGNSWIGGTVYAPKRGANANCSLKIKGDRLYLTVTKGLFSDTKIWNREP